MNKDHLIKELNRLRFTKKHIRSLPEEDYFKALGYTDAINDIIELINRL